ncbi:Conserved exported protein of uncharacterised function [Mycobacterium tuberculosis]|nr:Conserved exported protein of uncharacterised function [Mycobacterium tuberculosis]
MGAMGVMALALSVVGGAIGAGLGVGALSGMWGIPAVVAVATVGVVTVGVVGGGAGGGRGSVAACSAPADSACAPAAAGVPVVIPVVNDWPNDCGDNGAVAAAGGMPAAGTDGPPTQRRGRWGVGVVRRYMVGVGPASAGYYRTLALPVTTSARCYVVAINLVPTDHCQALSLPGRSVRRYLAWLHLAPADHYRMLRLLVGIPPSAKSSRRR